MRLPNNLRDQFKSPLGVLLPESEVNKTNIENYLSEDSFIISVGDRTTEKMIGFGLTPSLQIVDSQEKRIKRELPKSEVATNLTCNNPAGEITQESIDLIKEAFESELPVRILVQGEEDLLVIPVCILAPENSIVMYGQPNEGLVIVNVTPEIRNKTQALLDLME